VSFDLQLTNRRAFVTGSTKVLVPPSLRYGVTPAGRVELFEGPLDILAFAEIIIL
jgi:hypothetical protein